MSASRGAAGRATRAAAGRGGRGVRLRRRDPSRILLRPQVLLAAVALAVSIPILIGSFVGSPVEVALPPLGEGTAEQVREVEMPLVVVGVDGVPRSAFALVRSADHETARLRATLAALRETLVEEGVWPSALPPPEVAVFMEDRARVVVVDVLVPERVAVSVAAELAALRSIVETVRAAGADEVRVVVDGAPAATMWGNVALP